MLYGICDVNRNKKKNVLKKIVENTSQYYKKSFYIHDRCPLPKIFQLNVIYISYSVLNLNVLDAATEGSLKNNFGFYTPMHPAWRRCESSEYPDIPAFSRLANRTPQRLKL
jgi:hypothetical protein